MDLQHGLTQRNNDASLSSGLSTHLHDPRRPPPAQRRPLPGGGGGGVARNCCRAALHLDPVGAECQPRRCLHGAAKRDVWRSDRV